MVGTAFPVAEPGARTISLHGTDPSGRLRFATAHVATLPFAFLPDGKCRLVGLCSYGILFLDYIPTTWLYRNAPCYYFHPLLSGSSLRSNST